MKQLITLTQAELLKLFKQPLTRVLLAAMLILVVLNFRSKVGYAQEPPPAAKDAFITSPAEYRQMVTYPDAFQLLQIGFHFPAFFLMLLAAITVSQEFTWQTMQSVLMRAPGRGRHLLARLLALAAVSLLFLLALWLLYTLLGLWATLKLDGRLELDFIDGEFLLQQTAGLGRVWLTTLPAIIFGLFVGTLSRNAALSIVFSGMIYFLLWITLLFAIGLVTFMVARPAIESGQPEAFVELGIWGLFPALLPPYNLSVIAHWGQLDMMATDGNLSPLTMLDLDLPHNPWQAMALLTAFSIVLFAIAWRHFKHKDITA